MFRVVLILFCLFSVAEAEPPQGTIIHLEWPSKHAAAPQSIQGIDPSWAPLMKFGVEAIPEAQLIQLAAFGLANSPVPAAEIVALQKAAGTYYKDLKDDTWFQSTPSSLGYCFADKKPDHGFATGWIPENVSEESGLIIFIHGYGGSFKFPLHFLIETFPNHVILCPAWGISTTNIPREYLTGLGPTFVAETGQRLTRKPVLIGLSAGGFGAFRQYFETPSSFRALFCLAAYPPNEVLGVRKDARSTVRLLAGGTEAWVTSGTLEKRERHFKSAINYQSELVPDAGHFFMMTHANQTREILQRWMAELE